MVSDYTPTTSELAQLIPSRAAGRFTGGTGTPSFPDEPRVQAVIEDAAGLIAPALGGDSLDRQFHDGAKAVIKLQAALLLEPSAWPEQARPDKSAFEQWMQLLEASRKGLVEAVVRFRDEGSDAPGGSQTVIASFPPAGIRQAGCRTVDVSVTGDPINSSVDEMPWAGGCEPGTVDW